MYSRSSRLVRLAPSSRRAAALRRRPSLVLDTRGYEKHCRDATLAKLASASAIHPLSRRWQLTGEHAESSQSDVNRATHDRCGDVRIMSGASASRGDSS